MMPAGVVLIPTNHRLSAVLAELIGDC